MSHLRGQQWRESPRALAKKNRAKQKNLGSQPAPGDLSEFSDELPEDRSIGIVIARHGGRIVALCDHAATQLQLSGEAWRHRNALVPGDRVVVENKLGEFTVSRTLQRRSQLSRMKRDATRRSADVQEQVIAANVDKAVIVASASNPPFHPRFIDRYLILLERSGIEPVICLNKSDLASPSEQQRLGHYGSLGIPTVETSAVSGEGVEKLQALLLGKTAVLVGNSGVGKTSLINTIDPHASYRTGEVGGKTHRGRHTTTSSVLHEWSENSYIIDTPGIRALEVLDMEPGELQYYFPEFDHLRNECKYTDCLHYHEPPESCSVQEAVGQPNGVLPERYDSYIRLLVDISPTP